MISALALLVVSGLPGGLEVGVGPMAGSLNPFEDFYQERFMTPGLALGGEISLVSPGPVDLLLGGAYFHKQGTRGWDGEIKAFAAWAFPVAGYSPLSGFSVFAGPGIAGCWGDYSGTDDFGSLVEASGGSLGYGFTTGGQVHLWGPLSCSMQYRMVWMEMKSDNAIIDGKRSYFFPAVDTDLGFSGYSLGLSVSLAGGRNSVWR